jgi:integrase
MARPRYPKNSDLPTGLRYRRDRGYFEFKRIDGSTKNLGKDRKLAKKLAFKYNATYRVDKELAHEVCFSKEESLSSKQNSQPLGNLLPEIFQKLAEDKQWSASTLHCHKVRYDKILEFFASIPCASLSLQHINDFMSFCNPTDSKEVYNRYLGLLKILLDYCVSESVIQENPANKKVRRTIIAKAENEIHRLSVSDFAAIHTQANKQGVNWLCIAMELSLQTSHAVNEISKLKYTDIEKHIKIQRQKNKKVAASRVLIPLNDELVDIIKRSRADKVLSPYVVHRMRERRYQNRLLGKGLDHHTQLSSDIISRKFSELRDQLGLFKHLKKTDRPTFHDIRSLSIRLQEESGHDAQKRAAHSSRETTEIYKRGYVQWNEVPDVVIEWRNQNKSVESA